jgi:hypothetical protein
LSRQLQAARTDPSPRFTPSLESCRAIHEHAMTPRDLARTLTPRTLCSGRTTPRSPAIKVQRPARRHRLRVAHRAQEPVAGLAARTEQHTASRRAVAGMEPSHHAHSRVMRGHPPVRNHRETAIHRRKDKTIQSQAKDHDHGMLPTLCKTAPNPCRRRHPSGRSASRRRVSLYKRSRDHGETTPVVGITSTD